MLRHTQMIHGPGFVAADALTDKSDAEIYAFGKTFVQSRLHESEIHPDAWPPVVVHDPSQVRELLAEKPANKYTYHQLDDFTDLLRALCSAHPKFHG